ARAMQIPSVAHSALEYHRWLARSGVRPDGLRYARHMHTPIAAPVLHLHGALDSCVLPQTARGAGRYVEGPYRWRVIDGAGHFPQEERPEVLTSELLGWPGVTRDGARSGRPRNARPRDGLGRPLPHGAAGEATMPDDLAVTGEQAAQ